MFVSQESIREFIAAYAAYDERMRPLREQMAVVFSQASEYSRNLTAGLKLGELIDAEK